MSDLGSATLVASCAVCAFTGLANLFGALATPLHSGRFWLAGVAFSWAVATGILAIATLRVAAGAYDAAAFMAVTAGTELGFVLLTLLVAARHSGAARWTPRTSVLLVLGAALVADLCAALLAPAAAQPQASAVLRLAGGTWFALFYVLLAATIIDCGRTLAADHARARRPTDVLYVLALVVAAAGAAACTPATLAGHETALIAGALGAPLSLLLLDVALAREESSHLSSTTHNLELLFTNSLQSMLIIDAQENRIRAVNDAALRTLGYDRDELVGRNVLELSAPEDVPAVLERMRMLRSGAAEKLHFERAYLRKNGTRAVADCVATALKDGAGRVVRIAISASDLTEHRHAEKKHEVAERRLHLLIERSPIAITCHRDGFTLDANEAYLRMYGFASADELRGTSVLDRFAPEFRPQIQARIRMRRQADYEDSDYEAIGVRKDGTQFPIYVSPRRAELLDGPATFAFILDFTERKAAESKIRQLAYFDRLTGLANRQLLLERIDRARLACKRQRSGAALLLIDLDHFKNINDTLGHPLGDAFLRATAQRLAGIADAGELVARIGGDEFAVLMEDLGGRPDAAHEAAAAFARRALQTLDAPHPVGDGGDGQLQCTCSVGLVVFHDAALEADDLLRRAEIAMYEAKSYGGDALRFFEPRMLEAMAARVALEGELARALQRRELVLHYQVQVDAGGLPVGAEALVRWNHPTRGLLAPAEFVGLAESNGQIFALGLAVLEQACEQLARWSGEPQLAHLMVSINVSSKQFRSTDFVERVREALQRHGVEASRLELEITESTLTEDAEEMIARMKELKALGLRFSLDDFGTGYSSLQYLTQLPLDQIKIDQSFVRQLGVDRQALAIVRTVIAMSQNLGLTVLAEGVETGQQRDLLSEAGCRHYQGYLFGRPLAPEPFAAALGRTEGAEATSFDRG